MRKYMAEEWQQIYEKFLRNWLNARKRKKYTSYSSFA